MVQSRRHVLAERGVLAVTGATQVGGDALPVQEDLHGAGGEPHLHRLAGATVGDGVEVAVDVDVVVQPHLAHAPFGEGIGLGRQGFKPRGVDLREELATGAALITLDLLLVDPDQQLAQGGVHLGQAVEASMAQLAEQPTLGDPHCGFHLGLVPRPPGPRRQHRGVVVSGQLAVGAIDLRVVEAGLDDRHFGVVRHQQPRRAAEEGEGLHVAIDPVGELLAPGGAGEGQAGGTQHPDEDVRRLCLAAAAVDDHRHGVAGVVDEELVAAKMRLAHRHRQAGFPAAVELAKPAVAMAVRMSLDVLVPQDLQGDVLLLQLAVSAAQSGSARRRKPCFVLLSP